MRFIVIARGSIPPDTGSNIGYLTIDSWDDFRFVTLFHLTVYDEKGELHHIGSTKIGFKSQAKGESTCQKLGSEFDKLDKSFFSLGQSTEYYKEIAKLDTFGLSILHSLNDIVHDSSIIDDIREEAVFATSLLRDHSLTTIKGQFYRLMNGHTELTDYNFKFEMKTTEKFGGFSLGFNVEVDSKPNSNIHAIIGRNGIGKTTLLNGMTDAITKNNSNGQFFEAGLREDVEIDSDYFSSLVSVSFSAFDPFYPPPEQSDPAKGTCYFYIGLKDVDNPKLHRSINDLRSDCVKALINCFDDSKKTLRWNNAIKKLGSDENFSSMKLKRLEEFFREAKIKMNFEANSDDFFRKHYEELIIPILELMSSGHSVVLLTITRLVATVEEKTLVLLDEPESHLHPPLLSAFIRALSDLLLDRNGVAIIATHSPVVLQEIPKSCVWKMYRQGADMQYERPAIETFAENVGVLTNEVFNLEVERSGFLDLLKKSMETGASYDEILAEYNNQLGFEGRAILKAMISSHDKENSHD